ncbi:MAG: type II secretion system protein [Planctomycetota bacterium]
MTMVEALVAIVLVSTMLVAALNTLGAARGSELRLVERERALVLARALMAEIMELPYYDAAFDPDSFGLGAGEDTGTRSQYDDVDDYHGWYASPPQNKDGTVIPGCTGYYRSVTVEWVNATNLQTVSASNTGVKRIRVTAGRAGRPVVTLTGFRSQQWADPVVWGRTVWP